MSITLRKSLVIAASLFILSFGFFGTALAQTCQSDASCAGGKKCYTIQNSGNSTKRCLTATEYAAVTREGRATSAPGEGVAVENAGGSQVLINPLKVDSLEELLAIILDAVVRIGTIILILMLIWVGFLFVKARGNPTEIATARKALLWTVIGGLILLGAEALGQAIKSTAESL